MASWTKIWDRVVALGVPGLLAGLSLTLMGLTSFWWGFFVGEVSLLSLVVDIVYRAKIKGRWYLVSVAVPSLMMVGLLLYAFWPHPLGVMVLVEGSGYSGSAGGIEWVPAYGRVELRFDNHTSSGYDDAEFKFSAAGGLQIMNMAAVSGPINEVSLYPESTNMLVRFTGFTTPEGSKIPIVPLNQGPSRAYNITCKHIPANSTIGLIAAIAKINPLIGQKPGNLFADFMPPNYFHLEGSYVYNNKHISVDERLLDRTALKLGPSILSSLE